MSDQSSPITPPPELVHQWATSWISEECCDLRTYVVNCAAQWGWDQRGTINEGQLQERADQELEACCEWTQCYAECGDSLRKARRPKPPTLKELKEQALAAAARFYAKGHEDCTEQEVRDDYDALCRALKALPE